MSKIPRSGLRAEWTKCNSFAGICRANTEEVFDLPNIKSAQKRVQVIAAKTAKNKATKSALKTQLKKFEAAVAAEDHSAAQQEYKLAVKAVDQAASKGLLHSNNAANKKSRMTLRLNQIAH